MISAVRLLIVLLPAPMLLRSARLPTSGDYAFEPNWDGFRCLVSRNGRLRGAGVVLIVLGVFFIGDRVVG